jgi:hypothetical protein
MRSSINDLPAVLDSAEATIRQVDWGTMTVETGIVRQSIDLSPFFKGLPDDRCQCPHWGYVLKGQLRYIFAEHEEVYSAGDTYYAPPGHTPIMEAGCEYVEFSPAHELAATVEVVTRNMEAMGAS